MGSVRLSATLGLSALLSACNPIDCGPGTQLEGSTCLADEATETGDTGSAGDTAGDTADDSGGGGGEALPDTGPCAPPDAWATAPVPASLLTHTPYDAGYDAGLAALSSRVSAYGGGSYSEASIISGATVVAIGREPRWDYITRYYVADGNSTYPVNVQANAQIGDKVTFATSGYEGCHHPRKPPAHFA